MSRRPALARVVPSGSSAPADAPANCASNSRRFHCLFIGGPPLLALHHAQERPFKSEPNATLDPLGGNPRARANVYNEGFTIRLSTLISQAFAQVRATASQTCLVMAGRDTAILGARGEGDTSSKLSQVDGWSRRPLFEEFHAGNAQAGRRRIRRRNFCGSTRSHK